MNHISRQHGPKGFRKQVGDLTLDDLRQTPIWEFATDEEGEPGQDEETLRPRPDLTVADPSQGLFICRAELVANDGTRYGGYLSPSEERHIGFIQPTVVTDNGQVGFWFGMFGPKPGRLEATYEVLGKTAEQLFPLSFRALVEYKGVKLEGEIPAFMYRPDEEIIEVK
jgi:hypothetical protein